MKHKRYSVAKEEKLVIDRWKPLFDEKPYAYRQEWEAEIASVRSEKPGSAKEMSDLDLYGPMADRRKEAVLSTIKRVQSMNPDYPGKEHGCPNLVGQHWIRLNYQDNTLALLEDEKHILLAASIWILDQVWDDYENRNALTLLLPTDEELLDDMYTLDVWSPDYEDDLILSVAYVLHHRNEGIRKIEKDPDDHPYVLTDPVTALRKNRQSVPSREAFEKLLALIPEKRVQEACLRFKDRFWAWVGTFYGGLRVLDDQIDEVLERAERCSRRHDRIASELEELTASSMERTRRDSVPAGPFRMDPSMKRDEENRDRINEAMERLEKVHDDYRELLNELAHLATERDWYRSEMGDIGDIVSGGDSDSFDEVVVKACPPVTGLDPYELCFALVCLIDGQDELPWLTGAVCGFMGAVANELPWAFYEYDEIHDPIWDMPRDPKRAFRNEEKAADTWLERRYRDLSDDPYDDTERSLAQIIYEDTGCLLPRELSRYEFHRKEMSRWGLKGKSADMILMGMNLLSAARRQSKALNLDARLVSFIKENAGEGTTNATTSSYGKRSKKDRGKEDLRMLSRTELEKRVLDGQKETQRLSRSIRLTEQNLRHLRLEKEQQEQEAAREHQELIALRELLFRADLGQEEDSSQTEALPEVELPYTVRDSVLIFGGHDSWNKAIRPLLKGRVRFVGKDELFELSIIGRASSIWIQPNAISHGQYYRIIDEARRQKKAVNYFSYASAEKCVMQIAAKEEKEM